MYRYYISLIIICATAGLVNSQDWSKRVEEIAYPALADTTLQPALFFNPKNLEPRPLLVALHSWSGDFRQISSIPYVQFCIDNKWIFIHPNFRGVCDNPLATGSSRSVQDVIDAVKWVNANALVDSSRIYIIGVSWGASMALMVADQAPEIWTAMSLWCPIWDLEQWYYDLDDTTYRYRADMIASCGGAPEESSEILQEYFKRSPRSIKKQMTDIKIDLNVGLRDGYDGPVSVWHSLKIYNYFSPVNKHVNNEYMNEISIKSNIPADLKVKVKDKSYGSKIPLMRLHHNNLRFTVFDGSHEIIHTAGLEWLAKQIKIQKVQ